MKATRLPSGNWRCRVCIGTDAAGRRKWKSVTAPTKAAAIAAAADVMLSKPSAKKGTFGNAVDRFMQAREITLSPSTIRSYNSICAGLKKTELWEMGIYDISSRSLQNLSVQLYSAGRTTKTIRNYVNFCTAVLRDEEIPIVSPRLPRKKRPELNIPDETTVLHVIDLVKGTELELPVLLAAFGPMRRGEICALKTSDIKGDVIHVQRDLVLSPSKVWVEKPPKTLTSDRYITMPSHVMERIRSAVPAEDGRLVNYNPNQLTDKFRRMLAHNGIEPFRFHDLRHFCCSYLHGMGVPDIYIMQRSGHATSATLRQVYTHTLQDQSAIQTKAITDRFNTLCDTNCDMNP